MLRIGYFDTERVGIMNDMANVYRKRKSDELRELRSRKAVRLQKLESEPTGFFVKREIEILTHQIHQIDVELTARFYQRELPL